MRWRLNVRGVSLIELLIAMVISSVAISAAIQAFTAYGLRLSSQHATMTANQELRLGLDVLCSELRLAGGGLLGGEVAFMKTEVDEVEFFANLSGSATILTQLAETGRQDLPVEDGADWPKGKQVLLCTASRCTWNRLAADGRKQSLMLVTPTLEQYQAKSAVFLLNRVRYYVKSSNEGTRRLMREVDGVASTVLSDVSGVQLQYFNRSGGMATDTRDVVRVRVAIQVGRQGSRLSRDIAVRM
jgi:prepilin-type N-terminal cleavage/methylation domain-containing protein